MNKISLRHYINEKREVLFHLREDFFPRTKLVSNLEKTFSTDYITVLAGMRRTGKSFLLKLLSKKLILRESVSQDDFFYLNFEDPDLIDFSVDDFNHLKDILKSQLSTSKQLFLFCDEIQALNLADRILQSLQEIPNVNIIVTGSNAKLLSKEISTLLTGRHRDIFVPTLRYGEYIEYQNLLDNPESFLQYLTHSGFPLPALTNDDDLVKQYFNDIVTKDILTRYRSNTDDSTITRLYTYILSNIKNQFSLQNIVDAMPEIKSKDTVGKLLNYLENSYVITPILNYNYSLKKRYRDKTKFYTLDNGFITQVGDYLLDPKDTLMENAIFKELFANNPQNVYFLKKRDKKYDVDFYLLNTRIPLLVNVTLGFTNEQTKQREVDSLFKAMDDLTSETNAFVVTLDEPEEKIIRKGKTVQIIPAHIFLKQLPKLV